MEPSGTRGSSPRHRASRVGALTLLAGVLVSALLPAAPARAGIPDRCTVPDAYLKFPAMLDRTEALIGRKRPVRILVIGAEPSQAAMGAEPPLERALEQRLPGISIHVSEARSAGLADDDFEQLRTMVAAREPDLVIWQVGVRDALALNDLGEFESTLDEASAWVEGRGLDLVLVDPPFVPQVAHERIYVPYVGEIGEKSVADGVPVLRRYAAMQYWNIEREKRRSPLSEFTAKQPCMTELLAEAISRASRKTAKK
jgi:hypothetical protein